MIAETAGFMLERLERGLSPGAAYTAAAAAHGKVDAAQIVSRLIDELDDVRDWRDRPAMCIALQRIINKHPEQRRRSA